MGASNSAGICLSCQKFTGRKLIRLPCIRMRLVEIKLLPEPHGYERILRWTEKRLKNISNWASDQTRTIYAAEGFSAVSMDLEVRQFVPIAGDVLDRHWFLPSGIRMSLAFPNYAIAYMDPARRAYYEYINRFPLESLERWLKHKHKLLVATYTVAVETKDNPATVGNSKT